MAARGARLTPGAAKSLVTLARRIVERQPTATALADARLSMAHAQVLARTISEIAPCLREPAQAAKIECELVGIAEQTDPLRLSNACRRLRIQALPQLAACDDWDAFAQRDLSVSRTYGGLGVKRHS